MNKYISAFFRSRQRRSALRHLQSLDDRMLRDIGVTRDDLSTMFTGAKSSNIN